MAGPQQPGQLRRRKHATFALVALAASTAIVSIGVVRLIMTRHDRAALRLLRSDEPGERCKGAWLTASEDAPEAALEIARRLPTETDPDVRESYVYALGRTGRPTDFDLVCDLVRDDPTPYVRHSAWVACARLDPVRFQELAATTEVGPDGWDEIGVAYGWLEVGDVRGVDDLLYWAVDGTPEQQHGAVQALVRRVAPLLEAAGRWPIDAPIRKGEVWPREFVAQVRQRCAELDLQQITDDTWPHVAGATAVRRNAGRLLRARERLAWLLSGL